MDDTITLVSTTDTEEQVREALTGKPAAANTPVETPAATDKPADKPAEKPADAAADKPGDKPAEAKPEDKAPEGETPEQKATREADAKAASSREKRKNKIQAEIDELTSRKYDMRRDVEAEEAQLGLLRRQKEQLDADIKAAGGKPAGTAAAGTTPAATDKPAASAPARPEPQLGDTNDKGDAKYANYEDWMSDHSKWTREESTRLGAEAGTKAFDDKQRVDRERVARETRDRAQQETLAKHATRIEDFRKVTPDYDAVIEDAGDLETSDPIDDHIQHSEMGAAIVYHFAKNPEELARIRVLSPARQFVELGKVEAHLEAAKKPGPSSKVAPETKAPEPIKPVGGSPTASTVPSEDEDYPTYRARRQREEAAQARR